MTMVVDNITVTRPAIEEEEDLARRVGMTPSWHDLAVARTMNELRCGVEEAEATIADIDREIVRPALEYGHAVHPHTDWMQGMIEDAPFHTYRNFAQVIPHVKDQTGTAPVGSAREAIQNDLCPGKQVWHMQRREGELVCCAVVVDVG